MAHKKGAGSTKNGRDSKCKNVGRKSLWKSTITAGSIVIRQRGLTFKPEKGVKVGKDYTIYAIQDGNKFELDKKFKYVSVA